MAKRKPFKPTAPGIIKDRAEARRAFNKWHAVTAATDPQAKNLVTFGHMGMPATKREAMARDLVQYAAALGRKRGDLPEDLREWVARPVMDTQSCAYVAFDRKAGVCVVVKIPNFDAWPAPAVDESELQAVAA